MKRKEDTPDCLIPGCTKGAKSRGLCFSCYNAANLQVRRGNTTWAELQKAGLALVTGVMNRETPFAVAFRKLKEDK